MTTSQPGPDEIEDPAEAMYDPPCTICGTSIDPGGRCAQGHDDLDRADSIITRE